MLCGGEASQSLQQRSARVHAAHAARILAYILAYILGYILGYILAYILGRPAELLEPRLLHLRARVLLRRHEDAERRLGLLERVVERDERLEEPARGLRRVT